MRLRLEHDLYRHPLCGKEDLFVIPNSGIKHIMNGSNSFASIGILTSAVALFFQSHSVLFSPDPQFWVLVGIVITTSASIYNQIRLDKRLKQQQTWEEEKHQWEEDQRKQTREELDTHRAILLGDIAEVARIQELSRSQILKSVEQNSRLTIEVGQQHAVAGLVEAGRIEQRLESLASVAEIVKDKVLENKTGETLK